MILLVDIFVDGTLQKRGAALGKIWGLAFPSPEDAFSARALRPARFSVSGARRGAGLGRQLTGSFLDFKTVATPWHLSFSPALPHLAFCHQNRAINLTLNLDS